MIIEKNEIQDYGWNQSKTQAHNYIFPSIMNQLDKIQFSKDIFILDAGCGGGYMVNRIYEAGYKNIFGFDVSESGIKIAKENYKNIRNNFFVHNGYDKTLPKNVPGKYDLIISSEVIEHLYNPKVYLENINSWLNTNGILILTTPYHGYLKNIIIVLLNRFDKHFDPFWIGGHIKFFSIKSLNKLFQLSGFKILIFKGCGRLALFWKSIIVIAKKI